MFGQEVSFFQIVGFTWRSNNTLLVRALETFNDKHTQFDVEALGARVCVVEDEWKKCSQLPFDNP